MMDDHYGQPVATGIAERDDVALPHRRCGYDSATMADGIAALMAHLGHRRYRGHPASCSHRARGLSS